MTPDVLVNGIPARPEDLAYLAAHNYGAYTFFQVRKGGVRGLALHLDRLRSNAEELFGEAPSEADLRAWVRQAVAGRDECSVRVTTVSLDLAGLASGAAVPPDVVVEVSAARPSEQPDLRVRTVAYERETPWVKHRATHGLLREQRHARQQGFDDALFADRQGRLSEGTTWNLLVHDGDGWVWPEASVLPGVTMQLLRHSLPTTTRPVLPGEPLQAAFALNASCVRAVRAIDDQELPDDGPLVRDVRHRWAAIPFDDL